MMTTKGNPFAQLVQKDAQSNQAAYKDGDQDDIGGAMSVVVAAEGLIGRHHSQGGWRSTFPPQVKLRLLIGRVALNRNIPDEVKKEERYRITDSCTCQ